MSLAIFSTVAMPMAAFSQSIYTRPQETLMRSGLLFPPGIMMRPCNSRGYIKGKSLHSRYEHLWDECVNEDMKSSLPMLLRFCPPSHRTAWPQEGGSGNGLMWGLPKPPVVWNAIEHMMLITAEVTGAPQPPRGKLNLLSSVATGPETYPRCTTVQRSLLILLILHLQVCGIGRGLFS